MSYKLLHKPQQQSIDPKKATPISRRPTKPRPSGLNSSVLDPAQRPSAQDEASANVAEKSAIPPTAATDLVRAGFRESAARAPSEPLPFRKQMESAFGRNLGFVHVRTGATNSMQTIDAHAASFRNQIAFSAAAPGPWLVAHELTHVVQQHRDGGRSLDSKSPAFDTSEAEAEADRVADRVSRGFSAGPISARPADRLYRFAPIHHQRATAQGLAKDFSAQEIGQALGGRQKGLGGVRVPSHSQ